MKGKRISNATESGIEVAGQLGENEDQDWQRLAELAGNAPIFSVFSFGISGFLGHF